MLVIVTIVRNHTDRDFLRLGRMRVTDGMVLVETLHTPVTCSVLSQKLSDTGSYAKVSIAIAKRFYSHPGQITV